MGIPGVEYFAHPFEMPPRIAKEFLFTGDKMSAQRAYQVGMVNRLSTRDTLHADVKALAAKIATQPRLGLALTKQAVNHIEDLQGKRTGMDAAFAWHHFSHAHNDLVSGDKLGGFDAKKMAKHNREGDDA
jgi:enoyl-CoA hydratase